MERTRSLSAYRRIDLALFAAIMAVFEGLIVRVSGSVYFRDQAFTVSLAAAVSGIVYMRWGAWGMLHAFLAGAVYCVFQGAGAEQYAIYIGGNLLSAVMVPVMNRLGRERIRESRYLFTPISLGVLVLMQTGRAAISLALGAQLREALLFFTTDSLSAVFTLVIVGIARRLDGVYEEQTHYLRRVHDEEQKQENQ